MIILALDLATVTGWALGDVDAEPTFGSVVFGKRSMPDNDVFAMAMRWALQRFQCEKAPDVLLLEGLLPPSAMKDETTRATRDRLAGLHGIMRGAAALFGVSRIEAIPVGDVREHFISDRHARRQHAKRDTVAQCRAAGWNVADDNAADALALWSYGVARERPATAIKRTPLFRTL